MTESREVVHHLRKTKRETAGDAPAILSDQAALAVAELAKRQASS
jgi:hypothetical protein